MVYKRGRSRCGVKMRSPHLLERQCLAKWQDHKQLASDTIPEQQAYRFCHRSLHTSYIFLMYMYISKESSQKRYNMCTFQQRNFKLGLHSINSFYQYKTPQKYNDKLATKSRFTGLRNLVRSVGLTANCSSRQSDRHEPVRQCLCWAWKNDTL